MRHLADDAAAAVAGPSYEPDSDSLEHAAPPAAPGGNVTIGDSPAAAAASVPAPGLSLYELAREERCARGRVVRLLSELR